MPAGCCLCGRRFKERAGAKLHLLIAHRLADETFIWGTGESLDLDLHEVQLPASPESELEMSPATPSENKPRSPTPDPMVTGSKKRKACQLSETSPEEESNPSAPHNLITPLLSQDILNQVILARLARLERKLNLDH